MSREPFPECTTGTYGSEGRTKSMAELEKNWDEQGHEDWRASLSSQSHLSLPQNHGEPSHAFPISRSTFSQYSISRGSPDEEPVYKVKFTATNLMEGIFDGFGKNVINKHELHKMKKDVDVIVNKTENLLGNIIDKTKKAGQLFADQLNSNKQLSIKLEDESKEIRDQEKAGCAEALTLLSIGSRQESEDEEEEGDDGAAQASALMLTAPQAIQVVQFSDTLKLCPPDQFHGLKTEKADEIYPVMVRGRTRRALVICNRKFDHLSYRDGAEVDLLSMQDLLENLGHTVIIKENLSAQEMEIELMRFAACPEHRSSDSTFLVFMLHGILGGICGTRNRAEKPDVLLDDTIFTIFNNCNCKNLRNKPKILIIQACGSGIVYVTTDRGTATADTDGPLLWHQGQSYMITMTHVEKDFIAFKSTTPYSVSWRLDTNGSLFISTLVYYCKQYCWSHDLEDIFRKVQRSFEIPSSMTQLPTIERLSMTRYFYLFPGN
ncbi:LOW QUALITY PROTEIN: caspase-12-like [Ctenodactylus gundi]